VFYTDARYKSIADKVSVPDKGDMMRAEWTPIDSTSMDQYDAQLDPGSLKVVSAGAMRSVVMALSKTGMIPTETVLETFDIPEAQKISEMNIREKELSAMAKLKKPR
jgi:hypothetical protein